MSEMIEVYVPRATLETLVRAAAWYRDYGCDDDARIDAVDSAIDIVQAAVIDDMHDPLNAEPYGQ